MFVLVCGSWVLFRAPSVAFILRAVQSAVALGIGWERVLVVLAAQRAVILLLLMTTVIEWLQYRTGDELVVFRAPPALRGLFYAVIYYAIIFLGTPNVQPFIYFQF